MNGIVYYIYHKESGKGYVGKHDYNDLLVRFKCHIRNKSYIGNALRKHGKDSFKVVQLDSGVSVEELLEKEEYWINQLDTLVPNGYNILSNGSTGTSGWKVPEITRKALSFASSNPSLETREKMSKAQSGRVKSSEECRAISLGLRGRSLSAEMRLRISETLKGRIAFRRVSMEQVQQIRNSPDKTPRDWAKELGMNYHSINNIRNYRSFKDEP